MKAYPLSFVLPVVVLYYSQAQVLTPELSDRIPSERIAAMRSTIIPEQQENLFWSIYAEYLEARVTDTGCSSLAMNASNQINSWGDMLISRKADPSSCLNEMLENLSKDVKLKEDYFKRISKAVNGSVALQFLQTETLMDLLHRSKMYEQLEWSRPDWNASLLKDENAKFEVIQSALEITPDQTRSFKMLFEDYQFEFCRIAGEQLFFFEGYVDDVTFSTPGHCNQLGSAFLQMQSDEIKLRQRFFERISSAFDANLAARFLALDDYFTSMDKLKVWSDSMAAFAQK